MAYLEIKTLKNLYPGDAKKIIAKGSVIGVITTGTISPKAKEMLNEAGIAWVENIPEREFMESEVQEEG
jgi:hypothetical protein